MFIKILTVFNLYKLIDFIEENHRERYRVHPSLKKNKFDYCDAFEKVWASIDRPRESGRKEQGYKVFLKLKSQLSQANEKLKRFKIYGTDDCPLCNNEKGENLRGGVDQRVTIFFLEGEHDDHLIK